MARVQDVVTAVRKNDSLALRFPPFTLFEQLFARIQSAHLPLSFYDPDVSILRWGISIESSPKFQMQFRNILVRATNWLGDAVMSVPALQALRERFPDAHISILAPSWVAALYGR